MFEVSLSNLERNFELQNVKNIFEAPGRKIIGFLSVDGRVSFNINIANCDELSGIDSFSWSRDYNHLEECLGFRTYNSKLKCINEWSIQLSGEGGVVNQEGEWRLVEALTNIKDKYSDLSSNPSTCILQLNGDPVLLIQDVVVTLKLNSSSSVDITRSFQVKEFLSKDSVADSIVQKDFLFILEESGIISIYSLTQSRHIAVVKLIDYWKLVYQGIGVLSQSCKATHLAISSNLQHLLIYFTGTKFALHHVYLDDYFQHFPNHIHSIEEVASFIPEKDADEDDFDFYRKSKSTSRGWKSQVERLNSKLQVKGEIKGVGTSPLCNTSHHWFYTSKCNYKDEFSTQLKEKDVKISGFNKKIFQRQTSDRQDNSIRRSRHSSSSSQDSDSIPNKDSRHGSFILKIPKACRHSELRKLSAAIEITMLWFKGKGHGMMLLVDLQTNIQQCISFSEPTFVSTPCLDGQSPLLITSNTISAIAVGVDQEYLINKVMTYESATLAERLCQSNNWAHCSIPIHALEVGLKHRQLDTIAFFLKCREGVFSQVVESEQSINTDTEELWDALGLLLASIRENMSESQSKQYSDQLVHLTLTFVNRLIQNTWDTQKALEMDENMIDRVHDIKATSQKLMRYTCDLRGFLKDSPSWCTRTKSDVLPQTDKEFKGYYWCKDQTECEELNNFKTMSKKDVVESAILESCLPLAQAYLYQTMDQQVVMETDASSNSSADKHSDNESVTTSNSMNELIQIGRSMVIRSLINGDLNKASRILSNMGFNVKVELKQMCMQTTNRIVRDFLICELQKMGEFNAEEESAIEFIRHFEKLYPKHSFEEATLKSIERQTEHWKEPMAVISISLESVDDDEPLQSSLAVDASLEDHDHTHLPLECVQLWDKKTRERILFERIIQLDSTVPDLIPEEHISMVSAWEFLTSRADWKQIQNWIKASFPLAEEDTALEMPIKHPLETCVANQLELTPDFMKDWILDELATRGVFSSNEIQDFDKLLKRLSRIYRVISLPHPLSMGRMQVDMTDFCNQFVSFCVKRNLCSVLYEFLDNMDLCQTADDVTELDLPIEECPWLHMMLHFRWVGKYLSDPSYMFQTSLACSRVFMSSFQPSVMSLLGADRPLAAMATLMYAPGTLEQAMTGPVVADESLWKVDAKVLENSLKPYRTLHSTLFPNHVDGVPVQDVSVYDLLQAYSPFDVSKLFLWQSTNNVAIREEDQRYEMPQFSDSDLVSKYGHKEDLDFTYYLKQGRPSFAFTSFVEHQIELGGTSKKRISQAQAKACLIALKHFANQGIASACVAFIEMLGRDSTRLRVDLQTGNTIYNFQQKEEEWRKQDKQHWQEWLLNAEKKIAGNLLCAFRKHGKRSSELLIRLLESAISNKMVKTNKSSCSLEAAREWDVAVMFCRFHRLPLTDVYLRDCAKHDEWLCFTVFAQQHHYPKEHVLELVQTFKSTSLTEHLSLAFENPVYGSSFLPTGQHGYTTQSSVTKKKSIVRDHRTTYLFKVGFDSGKNGGEEDSTDDDEEADNFDDEYQHMSEHSESQFQDLVLENVPSDLFGVILACQSSPHPAKMLLAYSAIFKQPSLAVLSACFSNSDQLNCLCMFLMTSMKNEDVFMVTGNEIALLQWHQWNLDELMSIVRITMETGKSLILCKAFQVFQPASPLTSYLEFTCAYLVKSDEALAAVHLKNFHHKYLEIVENSDNLQETNTTSVTDINNLKFLEKAVSELTLLSFKSCCNFAATCRLLKLMAGLHFSGKFSNPVANYTKLYELSMIIKSTSVQLDIGRLLTGDGSVFHKHCQEVLEKLQAVKDFTSAKKFAIAAGLNMDHVVINQLKDELKKLKNNTQWNSTTVRELFWQKCNKELKSTKTSNKAAFQFFRSIASDVSLNLSTGEKIVILCLALEWLGKVTASTSPTYVGLEQDIWRLRVDLEIEKIKNGNKCHSPVDKVFISKPRSSHDIPGSGVKYRGSEEFLYLADYELIGIQPMKTADITVALNKIVKELLDSFCIIQAHKVCQQFSYFSQDLAVVLTCIRLARKQLTTEDLSTDMKMLLARGKRKRLSLSESVSSANRTYSFSSLSSVSEVDESDEILTCLETFCEHSNDGAQCCNRITNCYKVSQILNYTYEDIVTQSSIETLKIILQSNMPQQFLTAKEFIQTTCMNDADVSSFLADMIIKQVTLKAEQQQQGHALDSQVPLSRKPSDKDELTKFIKLCQNPATLGNRLIQEAKALLDNPSASKIAHTLQVELIIRAHDCHTICCNMEGISSVLRLCRDCTQVLGKAEEHRLMIRLIMGVGRCSEMMYTFEYLHKAKKLEHLIKIGSKDGKLKIALLDYLKRCKPPDPETYNMVSFKFRMHREIGEMLEKDAMKSLKALADRAMETNIELQNCLQEILQGLTEAAQNYAKENCLRHAEYCTCQARLVALQLHLLSTNTRVVNLDSNEFHKFITKHGKFHEALLVASAYSDQHVKWSNALYYNVIQQGNFVFLDDFKRSLRLEESHFTDMSSRYKHDQEKTPEMRENMKRLVGYCRDLKTAYDMATELNFQDIAMDMLKGDGGSYLRDII